MLDESPTTGIAASATLVGEEIDRYFGLRSAAADGRRGQGTMNRDELVKRIGEVPIWYHTLELAEGVVTPGYFDMRPFVARYHFPASMHGLTVVDVGTSNGQFAFHFEQLGARHVVATDLERVLDHDLPHWLREEARARSTAEEQARADHEELEAGFALAHEALGSRVEKRRCTVYDMGERMSGEFDLAFAGNLIQHLSDPVRALESIRRSLRPSGRFVFGCSTENSVPNTSYAIFSGALLPHVTYWVPSPDAALRMCRMAGYVDCTIVDTFPFSPSGQPASVGTMSVIHARNRS